MRKSRSTEPQIMAVLRQAESGVAVPELCRGWSVHNRSGGSIVASNGISTASFYIEPSQRHWFKPDGESARSMAAWMRE